jgi:hypothetical protein
MQWIATGFIMIINHLLQYVVKDLTEKEMHENATKLNISIALKLTIARFINSSLIMVICLFLRKSCAKKRPWEYT